MKIIVQDSATGTAIVLEISGDWRVQEGPHLNRITSNGVEHFFTHDGRYDGWGAAVSSSDQG